MSNVVGLQRPLANSGEYQELTKVLAIVSWSIQVATIIDAMGLPLSDALEKQDTPIPLGTKASSFGHTTIGSFITSGPDKQGLSKAWDEWSRQVKALRLKKTYEIHAESFVEIIDQFNDVTKDLGRTPASASEYHFAKDSILKKQRSDSDRRYQMQANEMQERISDLMRNLEVEQRQSQEQRLKRQELESRLESSIQEMNLQLSEAQRNHDIDLERKLVSQRKELIESTNHQLEEMRANSEMRVRDAQERLEEMSRYYEHNFISKADHEVVKQQLERERKINFDTLKHLSETQKSLDEAVTKLNIEQSSLQSEKDKVTALTRQVDTLTSRLNTIALAPHIGESSELAAELQNQIDELSEKLNASTTKNAALVLRERSLKLKLQHLKDQLNVVNSHNISLRSKLKRTRSKLRIKAKEIASAKSAMITLGVLLGASVITSVVVVAAGLI